MNRREKIGQQNDGVQYQKKQTRHLHKITFNYEQLYMQMQNASQFNTICTSDTVYITPLKQQKYYKGIMIKYDPATCRVFETASLTKMYYLYKL